MRSSSLPLLLGCTIALALPSAANAQDFTPIQVPTPYDALPIDGTTTPVVPLSSSSSNLVDLPFDFWFYGQLYTKANIVAYGYINLVPAGGSAATTTSTNTTIPDPASPNAIIAPWWDYNSCPTNGMRTQTYGQAPQRWFVVEWKGCYYNSSGTSNTFDMQVRLEENSTIIRVYYGDLPAGSTAMSATVGIESGLLTGGIVRGQYGLINDATGSPTCTSACNRPQWPVNTMIQYGRPTLPDLQAGRLRIAALDKDSTAMTVELENTVVNIGKNPAIDVTWDVYLSQDEFFDAQDMLWSHCRHAPPEFIPGASGATNGSVTATTSCTLPTPDPGTYRFCVLNDPDNVVIEANESNNWYCSDPFVIGSDLVGEVSIPTAGGLGSRTWVTYSVTNAGTDPTGTFHYALYWKSCDSTGLPILIHEGDLSLGGGEYFEETIEPYLDPSIQANTLCAELVIDPSNTVPELNETNNTASTCVDPGKICMSLVRANLHGTVLATMPHGCFFGDLVDIEIEICNNGGAPATNFATGFYFDTVTIGSVIQTPFIVSVPQSCGVFNPATGSLDDDPSLCTDIGGGVPRCIRGMCHPPCLGDSNGDCGNQGLECLDDPLLEVDGVRHNSCQLVVPAGQCKEVRATANLPTVNLWADEPLVDDGYYVIAIVDNTGAIGESNENDNSSFSPERFACWSRKPDFEAVSVRSLSPLGAGELFPVFRKVINNGVVGGVFSYRYVLSSNDNPSEHDIPLDIVRFQDGVIVSENPMADATIEAFGSLEGHDMIRVPANVVADDYHLGIVLDPLNVIDELDESNNTAIWCDSMPDGSCRPHLVQVLGSSFRVVTSSLRTGTVGQAYNQQLVATGGEAGGYVWSVSTGVLPQGLVLDPNGLIRGTPLEAGDFLFQVTVTYGTSVVAATFAIRVVPATSPLAITTLALPAAFVGVQYAAELGASGGTPPYDWSCLGRPTWANLEQEEGSGAFIRGLPTMSAGATVTCTVTDSAGATATSVFTLEVQAISELYITSSSIDSFDLGVYQRTMIGAFNGSRPYTWSIDNSSLPAGLMQGETVDSQGVIEGTPLQCGTFIVGVVVTDSLGATASDELPLEVVCNAPRLTTRVVPAAKPCEIYQETQLIADDAVKYAIALGVLPRGLTLSPSGVLSGRVTCDAAPGSYNVAIELSNAAGGTGLGALTVIVVSPPPPGPVVPATNDKGCSASGEGSVSGLLPFAALFAFLGLRRSRIRKGAGIALVAALALLAPFSASAQSVDYGASWRTIQYQRLDNPVQAGCSGWDGCYATVTLPFTFNFFDEDYTQVTLDVNGLIKFNYPGYSPGTNHFSPSTFPATGAPNAWIAPWWNDWEGHSPDGLQYQFRGTAPNREFVVQWIVHDCCTQTNPNNEFQVSLYEGGAFAVRWGPHGGINDNSAMAGAEDRSGTRGIGFLPCSKYGQNTKMTCGQTDFASVVNMEVLYSKGSDLVIVDTVTAPEANAGLDQTFTVRAANRGSEPASAPIELFISKDTRISADDYSIGRTPVLSFTAAQIREESITLPLPRELEPGFYYVLARIDPDDIAEEFDDNNNDGGAFRFMIRTPMPDLIVDGIVAPSSAVPGSMISLDVDLANIGNLDALGVRYRVVLSQNEAISASDRTLFEGIIDLPWRFVTPLSKLIQIPVDTPVGHYYLGVLVDPEDSIPEFDELNNVLASPREFVVTTTGLRVLTRLPSELQVGVSYCVPLEAEGGDGVYAWSTEGSLPPGIDLVTGRADDPDGWWLCGAPSEVAIYDFTLVVRSAGLTARAEYSVDVVVTPANLSIATQVLIAATFNVPYEAGLTAHGGRAPYTWELVSGTLPAGLTMGHDGLIYGRPLVSGTSEFQVQVTDDNANVAVGLVRLPVSTPGRVTCSSRTLGTVAIGATINSQLYAGGGSGTYTWTTSSTVRVGDSNGLPFNELAPPPGLVLDGLGAVSGAPAQIGQYLWTVTVKDQNGSAEDTCRISLEVLPGSGLTVTTVSIPVALVDTDYSAQLEATGGAGIYQWKLGDLGGLPNGLELDVYGVISGKLGAADLQDLESRTWSFLVEVRDEQNNRGTGALSVTLAPKKTQGEYTQRTKITEGCSTGAEGFSLVALGLVALGLRRRR